MKQRHIYIRQRNYLHQKVDRDIFEFYARIFNTKRKKNRKSLFLRKTLVKVRTTHFQKSFLKDCFILTLMLDVL